MLLYWIQINIASIIIEHCFLISSVLPKSVAISGSGPGGDMVEGQGATFECVVTGGNPRPLVFWLLNDKKYTTVEYVRHPFKKLATEKVNPRIKKLLFVFLSKSFLFDLDVCIIKWMVLFDPNDSQKFTSRLN